MRILFVNTFYYPNIKGGAENSVKLLAENLSKKGKTVGVYTSDSFSKRCNVETINGVKVYRGTAGLYDINVFNKKKIPPLKKTFNKILSIYNPSIKKEIEFVINDFHPDIIHTNNLYGISSFFWKYVKKNYKIPIIHTLRDYYYLEPSKNLKMMNSIYLSILARRMSNYVDFVTAPSDHTLNRFINNNLFSNSKKKCIPNAIELDEIETKKIIKNKQRRTTSVRFMYVGALIENKGIKNLINAFLNVKIKDVSLHIYGEGELKQYIYENSQKDRRIIYHGQLTSDKLKSEWIANDVLIVPSIWEEPFGRVIIEGNQFGLPVIGSNRGGIVEIINNIKTGELFDFKSIEDLTNKIIQFSNRKYIKQYYPAIIHNLKKYSISYQVGEFENVYHEIIGGDDYNEQ